MPGIGVDRPERVRHLGAATADPSAARCRRPAAPGRAAPGTDRGTGTAAGGSGGVGTGADEVPAVRSTSGEDARDGRIPPGVHAAPTRAAMSSSAEPRAQVLPRPCMRRNPSPGVASEVSAERLVPERVRIQRQRRDRVLGEIEVLGQVAEPLDLLPDRGPRVGPAVGLGVEPRSRRGTGPRSASGRRRSESVWWSMNPGLAHGLMTMLGTRRPQPFSSTTGGITWS